MGPPPLPKKYGCTPGGKAALQHTCHLCCWQPAVTRSKSKCQPSRTADQGICHQENPRGRGWRVLTPRHKKAWPARAPFPPLSPAPQCCPILQSHMCSETTTLRGRKAPATACVSHVDVVCHPSSSHTPHGGARRVPHLGAGWASADTAAASQCYPPGRLLSACAVRADRLAAVQQCLPKCFACAGSAAAWLPSAAPRSRPRGQKPDHAPQNYKK